MPLLELVIFSHISQVDDFNNVLPYGMKIQDFEYQGSPAYYKSSLNNIIAAPNNGLSQAQVDELNNLSIVQAFIPNDEEILFLAGSPIGSWSFVLEGSSSPVETYLTQATKMAIPSNLAPAILPAPLHIVSLTFMSEIDDCSEDIKIYLDGSLAFTWGVRNARWGILNSEDETNPLLVLPERGLISASIQNVGNNFAKDGILTIYFRLVGETTPGEFISQTL